MTHERLNSTKDTRRHPFGKRNFSLSVYTAIASLVAKIPADLFFAPLWSRANGFRERSRRRGEERADLRMQQLVASTPSMPRNNLPTFEACARTFVRFSFPRLRQRAAPPWPMHVTPRDMTAKGVLDFLPNAHTVHVHNREDG